MPKKAKGKTLTDEEKLMLKEQEAVKAAQDKAKSAEFAAKFLKEKLEHEEKNARINLKKLNAQWRDILRKAKSEELKKEITILAQTFERVVDHKDSVLQALLADLSEVEQQDARAARMHLRNMDRLIQLQEERMAQLQALFNTDLQEIKDEFMSERQLLLQQQEQQVGELKDVLFAMKLLYEDREADALADFNSKRDEVRAQSLDARSTLKAALEAKVAELWEQFQLAQRNYERTTEDKMSEFERLRGRDQQSAKTIDQQTRRLARIQEKIAACKHKLTATARDAEERHKTLRQEKDTAVGHVGSLKTQMARARTRDKDGLGELAVKTKRTQEVLQAKLAQAQKILKLGEIARKLETEEEKVLPFYADSVTRDELEAEFGPEEAKAGPVDNTLRPVVLTEDDQPVSQEHALDCFWKRYNKVLVDKLAMEREHAKLADENQKLRLLLKQYLDGISVNDEILSKDNTLLVVNHRTNAPVVPVGDRRVKGNVTVVEAAHVARANRLQ
eukprot:m.60516 g.60516  ORF g.60516 m.60516 type:complete len:504 (-) comp16099_c0_seq2:74-1585(-)